MHVSKKLILSLICLLTFTFNSFATVLASEKCNSGAAISKFHEYFSHIEDYDVSGQVFTSDKSLVIKSNFRGVLNKFFKISQAISQGDFEQTFTAVYDGNYQWIESRSAGVKKISKIALGRVTKKSKPFDTGYYIMGTGLINGEDYPGTLKFLLSNYDLAASCSGNQFHLQGSLNKQAYVDYIKNSSWSKNKLRSLDQFVEQFQFAEIFINNEGELIKYSIGEDKHPIFTFKVIKSKINQGLMEGAFKFQIPENAEVEDITKLVLSSG